MTRLDLVFGAIDLVVTPDGRYVFLEVNPTGQWAWFPDHITLPIRDAIATLLNGNLSRRDLVSRTSPKGQNPRCNEPALGHTQNGGSHHPRFLVQPVASATANSGYKCAGARPQIHRARRRASRHYPSHHVCVYWFACAIYSSLYVTLRPMSSACRP